MQGSSDHTLIGGVALTACREGCLPDLAWLAQGRTSVRRLRRLDNYESIGGHFQGIRAWTIYGRCPLR